MLTMEVEPRNTKAGWVSTRLDDEVYMRLALAEAQRAFDLGEVPIGAVVVYDPVDSATRSYLLDEPAIIAHACNLRETAKDPSAHAEFLAMKDASSALDNWRLTGCTVYVTLEPCIMCAGLMHQSRISRCVFGAPDQKAGALGTLYHVHTDDRLNHSFPVTAGFLATESEALLKRFFQERRSARKTVRENRGKLREQIHEKTRKRILGCEEGIDE